MKREAVRKFKAEGHSLVENEVDRYSTQKATYISEEDDDDDDEDDNMGEYI